MKITPAMRRCLEVVQSFPESVYHDQVKSWPTSVQLDTWQRCHEAGLLEKQHRLGYAYPGSVLTEAGPKALED